MALTCDEFRQTTPDDARRLLTLATSLALGDRTMRDPQHRNVITLVAASGQNLRP
jgi:hypothetical protein